MSVYKLVKKAKTGDKEAQFKLIEQYIWMIDACSKRNGVIDEDCKQSIIVQVIRAIKRFPI